jgi:TRAP-type C4-dicarboxylate transport system permease small subunit
MLLILADVVGRAAFDVPILGVPEMVQFSIVGIVFLQLPQTLRSGGLTRSELLLAPLRRRAPRLAAALEALFDLAGAALFALILATTWPLAMQAFEAREFYGSTGVVQIPTGPLKLIIIGAAAVMCLQFLLNAWNSLHAAFGRAR